MKGSSSTEKLENGESLASLLRTPELQEIIRDVVASDKTKWDKTIERVILGVVSVRFCATSAFDTDPALTSEATGFVVDAEKGYILTNRHVVGAGPFWGYVIFDNHEQVDCYPVYRDPVHDYGFLRFNVNAIKHMSMATLQLRPDLAKVGVEFRLLGNDAGEKLSILSGTISRVDQNAPEYGEGYNDFNTSYIQGSAAASGGSSGSPVVNIDGLAIALQAGGRNDATTDYFLPLDRPKRALYCLQKKLPITRGTIQCQWKFQPFDEVRRLHLTQGWENSIREFFPEETGMLVAKVVLPEGPSDSKIEEGDVLVKVNGEMLTQFVRFDEILDESVGRKVKLLLQRGGHDVEVDVEVEDLHKITPNEFVSAAGACFHTLSYQVARFFAVACRGVYVCDTSCLFRLGGDSGGGWIIYTIDGKDTPDLPTFIEVMKSIPNRAYVSISYKHVRDQNTLETTSLHIDHHWLGKMQLAVRNDTTGLWDFTDLADPVPPVPLIPRSAGFTRFENLPGPVADVMHCLVKIWCYKPVSLDGIRCGRKESLGLVIDQKKGLLVVSGATVPHGMCNIFVVVADSIMIEGRVKEMHPSKNYAVIQYNPELVKAPVKSARLSEKMIKPGALTYFVGLHDTTKRIVYSKTTVTDIIPMVFIAENDLPRYRGTNFESITVDTRLGAVCGSGVLVAEDGTIQALWLTYLADCDEEGRDNTYCLGLGTPTLSPVIGKIKKGLSPQLRTLGVELQSIQMTIARSKGVSESWICKVEKENPDTHQLFMVRKRSCGTSTLHEGDVILSLNDKTITRALELDIIYSHDNLKAVIIRGRVEMEIEIQTISADKLETERIIIFCGATVQKPQHAVRQQCSKLYSEVYVSAEQDGSPSRQYSLKSGFFIVSVEGVPTPDLDIFAKETIKIPDNQYFRLAVVNLDHVHLVITMKKNLHYFPTVEWIIDPSESCGWRRIIHEGSKAVEEVTEMERTEGEGGNSNAGTAGTKRKTEEDTPHLSKKAKTKAVGDSRSLSADEDNGDES